ncbi:hypothetical protein [Streptomyces sp. LN245]|uniref:hypothetical protein n=1 Tax=Streptomyces sp. LN245 TaxID=3112975 RepID=UPI003716460A
MSASVSVSQVSLGAAGAVTRAARAVSRGASAGMSIELIGRLPVPVSKRWGKPPCG